MKINLNAYRINKTETTVFISFLGIENDDFKPVGSAIVSNAKGEIGVIFHIQNDTQAVIKAGIETVSFKTEFKIGTKQIRVFYWNDSDSLANNLYCFEDFLEKNGLDENVTIGDFNCVKPNIKAILTPRQSGNGGVIGIVDL